MTTNSFYVLYILTKSSAIDYPPRCDYVQLEMLQDVQGMQAREKLQGLQESMVYTKSKSAVSFKFRGREEAGGRWERDKKHGSNAMKYEETSNHVRFKALNDLGSRPG